MVQIDIEMPKYCYDCPCHNGENGRCNITGDSTYDKRPFDCPLKEGKSKKDDLISRRVVLRDLGERMVSAKNAPPEYSDAIRNYISGLHSAINTVTEAPSVQSEQSLDIQNILDYLDTVLHPIISPDHWNVYSELYDMISDLHSTQPEKEIPKRVLWSGWKGTRYTRYNCPNCTKPVKNDDVYCHRCGQKLMFPKISFTPYVPGEKQEVIVRWDDEE